MAGPDGFDLAAIFIAIVGFLGTWAAAKTSGRASEKNANTTARVEMEKEAYERARKLDVATITRQDVEMDELREENKALKTDNKALHSEVRHLSERVERLELQLERHKTGEKHDRTPGSNPTA